MKLFRSDNLQLTKEQFLTVKETLEMLKIGESTLKKWEKEGKITPYIIGKVENVSIEDMKPWELRGKRYKLSDINKLIQPLK